MAHWTPQRAARLGYLAGRGLSIDSIMADDTIAARSERAVRVVASRWRVPIGGGGGFSVALSSDDRQGSTTRPWLAALRRPSSRSRCCGW